MRRYKTVRRILPYEIFKRKICFTRNALYKGRKDKNVRKFAYQEIKYLQKVTTLLKQISGVMHFKFDGQKIMYLFFSTRSYIAMYKH